MNLESVRRAKRVELSPSASSAGAAAAAVTEAHAHFDANAQLLERGSRLPEAVHQARVALRKLRIFVRLFRELIGEARSDGLSDELRYLFRQLGRVRDLQVVLDDAHFPVRAQGARGALSRTLRLREKQLERTFHSQRYARLRAALSELDAQLAAAEAEPHKSSAKRFFSRRLDKLRRKALREGAALDDRDLEGQHKLRKRLKRLRYVAELAQTLYPKQKAQARTFVRKLSKLQDTLGDIVDLRAGGVLLGRVHASPSARANSAEKAAAERERLLVGSFMSGSRISRPQRASGEPSPRARRGDSPQALFPTCAFIDRCRAWAEALYHPPARSTAGTGW